MIINKIYLFVSRLSSLFWNFGVSQFILHLLDEGIIIILKIKLTLRKIKGRFVT